MVLVNIDNKDYELHFGWGFLEYANEVFGAEAQGQKTNIGGMFNLYTGATIQDPATLVHIIKAGTVTERQKPSNKGITEFIEGLLEEDGAYEDLYTEIWEEIAKKPLLRKALGHGLTDEYLAKMENLVQVK